MKAAKHEIEAMEAKGETTDSKYDDLVFQYNYYDSKQKALKVFMNTFYGVAGNQTSSFFMLEVAGGVTQYGKENIQRGFQTVKELGCNVYYGDSVAKYTPILIKQNNEIKYIEIQDLVNSYNNYNQDKEISEVKDCEVWSDSGWTKIKHVIRHKTNKKLYRVMTHCGLVDVTEDHSLLDDKLKVVKPQESLKKTLLTKEHPNIISDEKTISTNLAWVYGLFVAEGSCGVYSYGNHNKASWGLVNQDLDLLKKSQIILTDEFPEYGWKILDCMESSSVYKLVPSNKTKGKIIEIATDWRLKCYYGPSKIVPEIILKSSLEIQLAFLKGYYWGDGNKTRNGNNYATEFDLQTKGFDIKSQLSAMSMYRLCKNLGYLVSINSRTDKLDIYTLNITKNRQRKPANVVKKIIELPQTLEYVYDIETESHHFAAGDGNLVVHNTDSLYLSVPNKAFNEIDKLYYTERMPKLEYWTKQVEISFKEIKTINKIVNDMFEANNGTKFLSMAYEEVLYPVAFTAKKKYFGIPHEKIPNFKPKDLFVRGLEVKKRGVSGLLRTIFDEIMWTAMSETNVYTLYELVLMKIDEIYKKKWDFKDFIQTDVYRPNKNNVKVHTFVRRMKDEYLIDIKPNERFEYVLVKKYPYKYDVRGRKEDLSVGDYMELVDKAKEAGMDVNLDYYMSNKINGQLARLIAYCAQFHVEPFDESESALKEAEATIYKNACKFIHSYTDKYMGQYNQLGKTYQSIFRKANKVLHSCIKNHNSDLESLLGDDISDFDKCYETQKKAAIKDATRIAIVRIDAEFENLTKPEKIKRVDELLNEYNVSKSKKYVENRTRFTQLNGMYNNILGGMKRIEHIYSRGLTMLVNEVKGGLNLDPEIMKSKNSDVSNILVDAAVDEKKLETIATNYTKQVLQNENLNDVISNIKLLREEIHKNELDYAIVDCCVEYLRDIRAKLQRVVYVRDTEYQELRKKGTDLAKEINL